MARPNRLFGACVALSMAAGAALSGAPALAAEPPAKPQAVPAKPKASAAPASDPAPAPPRWPLLLPDAKDQPGQWTKAEVEVARERCEALLKSVHAVYVPDPPMREGECGAAAPVRLISFGRNPQVTLSKPAIVTCDMVAALDAWFRDSVQPAARELLDGAVIRISVMGDYACRPAYGRKTNRLSEHGRANALDIRGFMTERSQTVEVTSAWGMTARDIRAQAAAAEAARLEAEQRAAEKAAQAKAVEKPAGEPAPTVSGTPDLRGPIADRRSVLPLPTLPEIGIVRRDPQSFSLTPPSRLGGPKATGRERARSQPVAPNARQAFIRRIHTGACRIFATVLGPEANDAHRDHFHIDMAERTSGGFCE